MSVCGQAVHAQGYFPGSGYGPANRPTYSPYLNLLRSGSPFGVLGNYQGLVKPQLDFRNSIQQLEQQQTFTNNQQTSLETALTTLPPTGHSSGFLSHNKFFMTRGGGVAGRFGG